MTYPGIIPAHGGRFLINHPALLIAEPFQAGTGAPSW